MSSVRRVVALTLVFALAATIAPPAGAQIGIPAVVAAVTAVINLIHNVARSTAF